MRESSKSSQTFSIDALLVTLQAKKKRPLGRFLMDLGLVALKLEAQTN